MFSHSYYLKHPCVCRWAFSWAPSTTNRPSNMDGHGFTKQSSAKKKATQFRSRMARSLTAPEDSAAYPTTAALDLLSASSSSAMLIDAATVSSTPSSTGEWFRFLRFLFISLKHAAFSALHPSMPTRPRVFHPRSTTVHLLCLWLIPLSVRITL